MIAKGGRLLLGYLAETILSTRDGPDHDKWLLPRRNCVGKRGVGRLVGEVFFTGEEAQKGAALLRVVVADGAAQHGIAGLERVQHRALRDRRRDFERHLAADVRQVSEMEGEDDADHVQSHLITALRSSIASL